MASKNDDQQQQQQQQQQASNLTDINRKIFEIRKKIQLSEGQRKAMFEVCEGERKQNADQILKLKQEISKLNVAVRDARSAVVRDRIQNTKIENIIGPVKNKTAVQIRDILDLSVRDQEKKLNLIKHQVKKKHEYLTKIALEYQELASKKLEQQILEKVDIPINKAKSELENSIHAVEVQWREAEHVKSRYRDIKKTLREDSAHFESNIKKIEETLNAQSKDIENLQQIMNEATKMRGAARNNLLKEEKGASKSGVVREKQTLEGQRLVSERRQELERIERRLFQSGKPAGRVDNSDAESLACIPEDSSSSGAGMDAGRRDLSSSDLTKTFEKLKEVTGATSAEEVLSRFQYQRETKERLDKLRKTLEHEKLRMEAKHELLEAELEKNKYAEIKEQKSEEMELLQSKIKEREQKTQKFVEVQIQTEQMITKACNRLQQFCLKIERKSVPPTEPEELIAKLEHLFQKAAIQYENQMGAAEKEVEIDGEIDDDKELPPSYSGLVRRTPIPTGTSPAPPPTPVSDDEEEVPSRGFLKRQAQIVVDAKSRRKNVRVMLPQQRK